ncbi:FMN-binding negative transcriptional regulator [Kocuria sp. cx-116]|uniref:FMN-binding negative transcriptional regulator n=1 Tax=Kocuria sp. cx-116 TaxID=2771378 RepID=UPI001688742F|nr:FMN-binding negative transcriptional regulator [Kocuria sp. cx-116]MBD2762235.1 FMN-binding negative transcriptional regulator [Kocuria sp. cx-116]
MLINALYQPVAGHDFTHVIADYPLGIIVGSELVAAHMPMLTVREADGSVVIEGHIPRADPLHTVLAEGREVLLIFPGPSAYISPDWYTRAGLPTYDFEPVHIRGRATMMDQPALEDHLRRLTDHHEKRVRPRQEGPDNAQSAGPSGPWRMDDRAEETMGRLLSAIAGFRLRPRTVEFKSKIGQNQAADEVASTADRLSLMRHPDAHYLADLMKRMATPPNEKGPPGR